MLSTSRSEGELSYRLQLDVGDGSLGEELLLDTSSRPGAIVVADINGDAFDDIIVSGTSIVFWLYDRMDFDDPDDDEYRLGGTLNVRGQALAVANLNEDTQLDIIVGTPTGELSVFLQAPGSSDFFNPVFLPATDYDVDGEVFDIEIGDLDRDGRLDIAAVTSRSIAVLLQQLAPLGSGEFRDAVAYPIRGNGRQLVIDNIDGDNLLDLAATNYLASGGGISIWLQDDGVVGADFVPGPYIRATSPWGLGVADFNRDNLLDFAFANVNGASIVLQDWRNPGEFLPPDPDTNPVGGDNNPED